MHKRLLNEATLDFTIVPRDDDIAILCLHGFEPIGEDDLTLNLGPSGRLLRDTSGRTSNVERTQGELSARLADRLGRENTDRLAQIDQIHCGEVSAVAHAAQTAARLACEHGTNGHALYSCILDYRGRLFVDQFACRDE